MQSDKNFYTEFKRSVLLHDDAGNLEDITAARVAFFILQYKMIPPKHKTLFANLIRGYPTPPIYAFLGLGMLGTNIARFSVVQRLGAQRCQSERTGAFYHFIAPSRLGKGVALSVVTEIASHIEGERSNR